MTITDLLIDAHETAKEHGWWDEYFTATEFGPAYDMAKIPTRSFFANAVYLEIALWAYDLVMAFKALCLP